MCSWLLQVATRVHPKTFCGEHPVCPDRLRPCSKSPYHDRAFAVTRIRVHNTPFKKAATSMDPGAQAQTQPQLRDDDTHTHTYLSWGLGQNSAQQIVVLL